MPFQASSASQGSAELHLQAARAQEQLQRAIDDLQAKLASTAEEHQRLSHTIAEQATTLRTKDETIGGCGDGREEIDL